MELEQLLRETLQLAGDEGLSQLESHQANNRGLVLARARHRRRNLLLLVSTAALALVAGGVAWAVNLESDRVVPISPHSYVLNLPEEADDKGNLVASTNLPEGTRISVQVSGGGVDGGTSVSVEGGKAVIRQGSCPEGFHESDHLLMFDLTVTVRPTLNDQPVHCPLGQNCLELFPTQPQKVLEELGERFERLHGEQVTKFDGGNQIQLARSYELPGCVGD